MKEQDLYDASSQLFMDFYKTPAPDPDYRCRLWDRVDFDHEFNLIPCCCMTTAERLGNLFEDDPDKMVEARERYSGCAECISSGHSALVTNAPSADWYTQIVSKMGSRFPAAKVYFDCGSGETEEASQLLPVNDRGRIRQRVILPPGCRSIRFDPAEEGCLLWGLRAKTGSGPLKTVQHNGLLLEDMYVFRTNDPQIRFEQLPPESRWVDVDAYVARMDQGAWDRLVRVLEALEAEHAGADA